MSEAINSVDFNDLTEESEQFGLTPEEISSNEVAAAVAYGDTSDLYGLEISFGRGTGLHEPQKSVVWPPARQASPEPKPQQPRYFSPVTGLPIPAPEAIGVPAVPPAPNRPDVTVRTGLAPKPAPKTKNDSLSLKNELCPQTDPEAFFPENGESTREAKKVCLSCDARSACLEWALETDQRFGIWGGLSESERRKLKKQTA